MKAPHGNTRIFPPEQIEEIKRLYVSRELNTYEIAAQFKTTQKTVLKLLTTLGVNKTQGEASRIFSQEEEIEIANQYSRGKSIVALAKQNGCTHGTIRNVLIRQKVKVRSHLKSIGSFKAN